MASRLRILGVASLVMLAGLATLNVTIDVLPALRSSETLQDMTKLHRVMLQNRTSREYQVIGAKGSCPCISFSSRSFVVPASGQAEVDVRIAPPDSMVLDQFTVTFFLSGNRQLLSQLSIP